jgi:uncharacterized phage protein (TIGR02218 family)
MAFNDVEISAFGGNITEFYKITVGTTIYRYNNGTQSITLATGDAEIDGAYTPVPSIEMSEIEHARDVRNLAIQLAVPRDNPVALLFRGVPPDGIADILALRKHASDPQVIRWWRGTIEAVRIRESQAQLICAPTLARLATSGLQMRWQLQCNLQTYSARCGLNIADYSSTVTITAISGLDITVSGMPAVADGYYNGGFLIAPDGKRRMITSHVGSVLTLLLTADSLAITDSITIVAGDDHSYTTCKNKFTVVNPTRGNVDNFLGIPTAPNRNPWTQGGLTGGRQTNGIVPG